MSELIARVEEAIEHQLALSVDDLKLLLLAISTLCALQEKIEADDITLHKLRKLLGMVQQSERRGVGSQGDNPEDKDAESQGQPRKKGKNKKKKKKTISSAKPPKQVYHTLTRYQRGQECPACCKGKLYKFDPGIFLHVTGHARFEAEKHIIEQRSSSQDGCIFQRFNRSAS